MSIMGTFCEDIHTDQRNVGENSCNPWRQNGSKGPILDVYDDYDDDDEFILEMFQTKNFSERIKPHTLFSVSVCLRIIPCMR